MFDLARYQGYVCPGILVTLAREDEVACLQAAWASSSILCPQDLSILRFSKKKVHMSKRIQNPKTSDWVSRRDVQ